MQNVWRKQMTRQSVNVLRIVRPHENLYVVRMTSRTEMNVKCFENCAKKENLEKLRRWELVVSKPVIIDGFIFEFLNNTYIFCLFVVYKKPLDLAFLIGSSGKNAGKDFNDGKAIIEKMLDSFEVSKPKTHVAVVDYSGKPTVKIPFKLGNDPNALKEKVKNLPRGIGGLLKDGIKLVADELFTAKHGSRPKTKKSLVIITNKEDVPEVEKEKKKLKKKGVKVVVLALGDAVKSKKAKKLPSTPNLLEVTESLKKKPQVVDDLVEKVTQGIIQKIIKNQ